MSVCWLSMYVPWKTPGRKRGLPVLRLGDRVAAGAHDDEAGQVLVLGPEPVEHPRPDARPRLAGVAAVHQHQRGFMVRHVGVHRPDHADVVDALGRLREQLADLDAALAVLLELERRGERRAGLPLGRQVRRQRLARLFGQRGLGVERVDMGRPAVHEQVDDPFGLRRELRRLRRQRVGPVADRRSARAATGEQARLRHQVAQGECSEPHPGAAKRLAAGHGEVGKSGGMVGHRVNPYMTVMKRVWRLDFSNRGC